MSSYVTSHDTDSKETLQADLMHYRTALEYMGANVPLGVLCLPKEVESCLTRDGCVRVYDLISRDLTKIKGLGTIRRDLVQGRLDEFFSMSI